MLSPQAAKVKNELLRSKTAARAPDLPLEAKRQWWREAAAGELPEGCTIREVWCGDTAAEWMRAADARTQGAIMYFHGGGFVLDPGGFHRRLAALMSVHTKLPVLMHHYPLAPESPFPAALYASLEVYSSLLETGMGPKNILIAGDSSGGGLALAFILLLKSKTWPLPRGAFLLSPLVDFTFSGSSFTLRAKLDPVLSKEEMRDSAAHYLGGISPNSPFVSPLFGDFENVPPLLIQTGSDELLLSDSMRLEQSAKAAGVDVRLQVWNGLWHVFHSYAGLVPESDKALDDIARFTDEMLGYGSPQESVPAPRLPGLYGSGRPRSRYWDTR